LCIKEMRVKRSSPHPIRGKMPRNRRGAFTTGVINSKIPWSIIYSRPNYLDCASFMIFYF
jgi:hypothetical protein